MTGILKLIFRQKPFLTILFITTTISFSVFHYQLYSPTLTIKVPNGYNGEINLVLSNVEDNILTIDTNGIGYLTHWTFNKTYSRPIVEQIDGKNLDDKLLGFSNEAFFSNKKSCCVNGLNIESLSFKIVSDDKVQQKPYDFKDLTTLVNKNLLLFSELEGHTKVQHETPVIDTTKK